MFQSFIVCTLIFARIVKLTFGIFCLLQDVNVQNLSSERPGLVRGFRKNLGGRWRRLVKKKPETEAYTIPAELRPQLKQIYVY